MVWKARYEPFGGPGVTDIPPDFFAGESGIDEDPDGDGIDIDQPIRFPGQWDDGIPGVWYNHHRFYLLDYGIYNRRDPIPRIDGREYSYVAGNPVMWVDAWGLFHDEGWPVGHSGISFGTPEHLPMTAHYGDWIGDMIFDGFEAMGFYAVGEAAFAVGGAVLGWARGFFPSFWDDAMWAAEAAAGAADDACRGVSELTDDFLRLLDDLFPDGYTPVKGSTSDWVIMGPTQDVKVRIDFSTPYPHINPHAHVERLRNGVWEKSGPIYPVDVVPE